MNFKKLGLPVLCCGAAFLTSCGYTYNTKQTLTHDEAVEWVKKNYGEEPVDFVAPTSSSSEFVLGGYINDSKTTADYGYYTNHLTNFLVANAHVSSTKIDEQKINEKYLNYDEFGWKTETPLANETEKAFTAANFPKPIRGNNFDDVLDYCAYYGLSKFNCDYTVDNKEKTLTISGTYDIYTKEENPGTQTIGYNIIHIPDCSIKFNKNGCLEYIKFDISRDAEVRYNWYNETRTSWSGTISGIFLKGSYIYFTYNY